MSTTDAWMSKDGKRHRPGKEVRCAYCGTIFTVQAYRTTAKYCSQEHYYLARKLHDIEVLKKRFWAKVKVSDNPSECWEWQRAKTHRYGNWGGYGKGRYNGRYFVAHRVAWELTNNMEIPQGMIVMHTCDNPPCCNPNHLVLGTDKTNAEDKMAKGRHNPFHKLNADQVREIRRRLAQGETAYKLGPLYGVDKYTIGAIKRGVTWKHII